LDLWVFRKNGDSATHFQHMAIGSDEGIDGITVQVFEISQINDNVAHVIFNEESNGVFQFCGVENLAVAQSRRNHIKDADGTDIEFDKNLPVVALCRPISERPFSPG
jgi:hypothetical protein